MSNHICLYVSIPMYTKVHTQVPPQRPHPFAATTYFIDEVHGPMQCDELFYWLFVTIIIDNYTYRYTDHHTYHHTDHYTNHYVDHYIDSYHDHDIIISTMVPTIISTIIPTFKPTTIS